MRISIRPVVIATALATAACTSGPTGGTAPAGGTASAGGTDPAATAGASAAASSVPATPTPSLLSTAEAAAGRCGTPVTDTGAGMPDLRGTSPDAELWALPFAAVPFKRGEEVKIVWRMTGSGPLVVGATLPDGTKATLAWGPQQHSGSNWKRPGEEWGTGLVFPKKGCWKVHLTRTAGQGDVWFAVR
ncbi:hypothetical protein GCM10023194_34590 [Planotetraspora phitsanulokensis]|uniref:Uncharacterized protein n=1 Tax=Planotetraspora phitsanulokensis TaxID=575192 RepID=A0A8J3XCQ7_9ACTN|nr:hypothetical protein [Planotetraspora phitsanulokensis]GII36412.1 hypothetical protein Pph01_14150 [Planotetraspora phitsanulokensis]